MPDFTSALYLGLRHPWQSLRPWSQFTRGKPAALGVPPAAAGIAGLLQELQGCERVTLLPSTLHLFFDLFEVLRQEGVRLYIDASIYPIVRWGAERAAARGVSLRELCHYDPIAARRVIAADNDAGVRLRPVIVADGFCTACGRPAPLRQYLRCVEPYDGYVVLDDTQAIGIWGQVPSRRDPFGRGGGGSLRFHAVRSPKVIIGCSLAKGFGVPLAALSGSARFIRRFQVQSETRIHSSPPSMGALRAAEHALELNRQSGDAIRRRLAGLVDRFRANLRWGGLKSFGGLFPVQMLASTRGRDPIQLQRSLLLAGVRTLVVRDHAEPRGRLAFVLNASHKSADIDHATAALMALARARQESPGPNELLAGWHG
jgi:8-amino-7-oxononanoate synthase